MIADVSQFRPGLDAGRFCRYILPLLVWMAFIFAMSTHTGSAKVTTGPLLAALTWLWPDVGQFTPGQKWVLVFLCRKLGHLMEYLVLTLLVVRAVQQDNPVWNWRSAGVALFLAVLYALGDEWHQGFVPSRTPNLRDVLLDSAGVLLALGIAWVWYRGRQDPVALLQRLAELRRGGYLTEEEFHAAKAQWVGSRSLDP